MSDPLQPITVGRYLLHRKIARGGMATIHIARLMGDVGFSRIVAAKRMHPELVEDQDFVAMFLDEARIASKVHHRNVVPVLDVVTLGSEVVLFQEYVHGAPLSLLLRASSDANAHVPIPVAAAIACQVLAGLHAAHETCDEMGERLDIVHRDVSPQNVIIAADGSARLLDFGVAKAAVAAHVSRKGTFKGKLGYSSPEQIRGEANKQSDVYSLGVVLWEMLVGSRMHASSQNEAHLITDIMKGNIATLTQALADQKPYIGSYRWSQLEALEPILKKALDIDYRRRYASAADMEEAITAAVPLSSASDMAAWLRAVGKDFLEEREHMIAEEEGSWRRTLAMTEAAVPLPPTESVPIVVPHQASTGIATEPEGHSISLHTLLRRGPTALAASLVILFAASVAFFMRDRDKPTPAMPVALPAARTIEPTPPRTAASPPVARSAHVKKPSVAPTPSPVRLTVTAVAIPSKDEREERLADEEAPAKTIQRPRTKRTFTAKPTPKPRAVRAAAPASTPAPSQPARSAGNVDCNTPFYFEGSKKIFKAGCL